MSQTLDTAEVRRANLALIAHTLATLEPCARTDIKLATGLVSTSVSSLVEDLIARGLTVENGEIEQGKRGRPRRLLTLNAKRVVSVVVSLTPVDLKSQLRDLNGGVAWSRQLPSHIQMGQPDTVVEAIADAIDAACDAADALEGAWLGPTIVAIPGPVIEGHTLAAAIPWGLDRVELFAPVVSRLRHHVTPIFMNDGRLAALAEYEALPVPRAQSMAYLFSYGTGAGGGLIIDGNVYGGSHLLAGECGNISVDMNGPLCRCGAHGCLETYIVGVMGEAGLASVEREQGHPAAMEALIESLQRRDAMALAAVRRVGAALACAIGTMSNYTDLGTVVLGGDFADLYEWLPEVGALLSARASHIAEFAPIIAKGRYGPEATPIGMWRLARQMVLDDPDQVPFLGVANLDKSWQN